MNDNYIQFKKQREIGAILSDTFKFIRLEWKPLFTLILKIAGPALAGLVFALVFYLQNAFDAFSILVSILEGTQNIENFAGGTLLAVLVMILSGLAFYSLLYGTVLHYIRSYVKNNGMVNKEEVTAGIKQNFWSLMGLSILVGLITFAGFIICFFPGIYLGTVLATSYAIHIIERRDVTDTISYSFNLIKGEWWATFATYIVIFLLYYFATLIFQVPLILYMLGKGIVASQEVSADPTALFDWVYITLNAISTIFQYILYTIIIISSAFVYYHLNEKKNFTGTIETIDSLGNPL